MLGFFICAEGISQADGEVVPTPCGAIEEENNIRDIADRPILRAAVNANVDLLLTGDKDFLESGIIHPKIVTATEFVVM